MQTGNTADGYMPECNHYLVDHAGTPLAIYNGGDAAERVRYARQKEDKNRPLMKTNVYTKRELNIIRSKKPLSITCEEYLAVYHKAFCRNEIQTLNHLADIYQDMAVLVFSDEFQETHGDPADLEGDCPHPVLLETTRYTQARVMDMVAYLLGKVKAPEEYARWLHEVVPFRLVFNYFTDEFVADYHADPLWENYFWGRAELRRVLELRSIKSLDELVVRASDYFERLSPLSPV